MKTLLLFTTSLLLSITTVSATEIHPKKKGNNSDISKRYRYAQPIMFIERGVEFMVFPDGSFDFDVLDNIYSNNSNNRRTAINASYDTKNLRVEYSSNRFNRPMIVKDRFGNITRIGNTSIYYDRMGDVTQIGSVDIVYNRGIKMVSKIGGLRVNYDHWGQIVHSSGYVNHLNRYTNSQLTMDDDTFYDDHYNANYFYYKKNGDIKKLKKNKH
ncbi:MAG: hypothetical protein K9I95_06120 [Flavobacteriaceae bacterium]|jgi:hypothetical protein|nr:hypothetical protein [Flavobacteriaceae bacterium]